MRKLFALLYLLLSLSLSGCGGGSTNTEPSAEASNSIQITGQLSNISASMNAAAASPDKLIILVDFENVVEIPVNSDGTFTINKDDISGDILIIFPINEGSGEVYGNIKVGATSDESLDFINTSTLSASLNLGFIDLTGNSIAVTTVDSSNAFKADKVSEVKQLSRRDNGLAMYENGLRNENIDAYIDIVFRDSFSSVNNQYSTVISPVKDKYQGIRPRFYLDKEEYDGILNVDLYPPSEITRTGGQIMNPTTPNTLVVNTSPQTLTVEADYVSALPEGDWLLKDHSNNEQIGSFMLSAASPFDVNDKFLGVIPKVKIVSDGSGVISSVKVQLFTESTDGTISQVSQSYLNQLVSDDPDVGMVFSYVMDGDGSSSNFIYDDDNSTEDEMFFKTSSSININNMSRIIFSYTIGGSKYQFFFE